MPRPGTGGRVVMVRSSSRAARVGGGDPVRLIRASGAAVGIAPVQCACTPAGGDPEADGDALGEGDGDADGEATAVREALAPACGAAPQPASRKAPSNRAGILMPV